MGIPAPFFWLGHWTRTLELVWPFLSGPSLRFSFSFRSSSPLSGFQTLSWGLLSVIFLAKNLTFVLCPLLGLFSFVFIFNYTFIFGQQLLCCAVAAGWGYSTEIAALPCSSGGFFFLGSVIWYWAGELGHSTHDSCRSRESFPFPRGYP